ncbi:MAG: hypothetical protein GY862_37380 [Gammaproteobacteria bacterium]|nr:hypothetical protein [Gammaproteobacteria bacterium]
MNVHYLIDAKGHTDGVVVPAGLWQRILDCLEKSPEYMAVLKDIPGPPVAVREEVSKKPKNPLKALLESDFVGCFEAEPDLSVNYKAEFGKILDEKYDHC